MVCGVSSRVWRGAMLATLVGVWAVPGYASSDGAPMLDESEEDVPVGTEPDGAEDGEDETGDLESELAPSDAEVRGRLSHGVSLGVGQSGPWQQYALTGYWLRTPDVALTAHVGTGRFSYLSTRSGTTYEINIRSTSSMVGARYYWNESFAGFVDGLAGWARWAGEVAPSAGKTTASAKVASDFSAHGPFVGAGVGLARFWESGWYMEVRLIGTSRAWVLSNSADNDTADDVIATELERAASWGLLNVHVGRFW